MNGNVKKICKLVVIGSYIYIFIIVVIWFIWMWGVFISVSVLMFRIRWIVMFFFMSVCEFVRNFS